MIHFPKDWVEIDGNDMPCGGMVIAATAVDTRTILGVYVLTKQGFRYQIVRTYATALELLDDDERDDKPLDTADVQQVVDAINYYTPAVSDWLADLDGTGEIELPQGDCDFLEQGQIDVSKRKSFDYKAFLRNRIVELQ